MVYQGTCRPKKWRTRLRGWMKVVGYAMFTLLGILLCMSEDWIALGIPLLILMFYKAFLNTGHTAGRCPYCGTHIKTKADWAVVCKICHQRSYVRSGNLLGNLTTKHTIFRYQ